MIGDLRYFLKKLKKPNKEFKRTEHLLCFDFDQINTVSPMKKCKLTIVNDGFWLDEEKFFCFTDIANIENVDTKTRDSNKGSVIKITFFDRSTLCLSMGSYPSRPATLIALVGSTGELYCVLKDKWEESKEKSVSS